MRLRYPSSCRENSRTTCAAAGSSTALSPALTIHRRCPGKHSRPMIALFADKLIISTENNSLACRCQPGPQPNRYPRAIQTSETTPCVFLRSAGKARYASYPQLQRMPAFAPHTKSCRESRPQAATHRRADPRHGDLQLSAFTDWSRLNLHHKVPVPTSRCAI